MEIHVTKHHQAYVTNLNASLVQYAEAESKGDFAKMIQLQSAIKFNGGGHVNHSIFWTNLCPAKDQVLPSGDLLQKIEAQWKVREPIAFILPSHLISVRLSLCQSLDNFKTTMSATSAAVQGSGWGWLGYNKATDRLEITTMPNQDPLSTTGLVPLLGIDVWEVGYS